jgi:hypothetical protein
MAYALQRTSALRVDAGGLVRFTRCTRPIAPEHRPYMALESQAYGNVLLFNCTENRESGQDL